GGRCDYLPYLANHPTFPLLSGIKRNPAAAKNSENLGEKEADLRGKLRSRATAPGRRDFSRDSARLDPQLVVSQGRVDFRLEFSVRDGIEVLLENQRFDIIDGCV